MKMIMANKFHRPQGGCETVYFSEIDGLRSRGVEVAEFSMFEEDSVNSKYTKYFSKQVSYEEVGVREKIIAASKTIYNFDAKKQLSRLLDDECPDLFHAHNIYHQISPSIFDATSKRDVPSLLTSHDLKLACPNYKMYVNDRACEKCLGGGYWNCMVNKCSKGSILNSSVNMIEAYVHKSLGLYNKIDRIICPSHFNADMLIRAGYDYKKISVLPNGIKLRDLPESSNKDGYILFVGRVTKDKGVGNIVESARRLPEIEFKIVGDGPDLNFFKSQAESLSNVSFLGFKSRDEVDAMISKSNGVIVSSLLYENCPMSILEAMALGKVVIGSSIGGIPEIIKQDENGYLYENNDIDSLVEKVEVVMAGGSKINQIEMNAKQDIINNYSENVHLDGLLSIYNGLLR